MVIRSLLDKLPLRIAAIALGSAFVGLACGPTVTGGNGGDCTYDGQTYEAGETFPDTDGCNTCSCGEDGSVACTTKACLSGCEWNGAMHEPGDVFPAGDGCNTCSCAEDGSVACTKQACPMGQCSNEGYFHAPGESWLSNNQCAACFCDEVGQAICSDNGPCTTCYYAGTLYTSGQTFPALDGCNDCTCDDGSIACTEIACACDPAQEWWRSYIGDAQSCATIDFDCAPPTVAFQNSCGCGCEQPSWCPQVFDCEPPKACDVEEIGVLCPMSQIAL